ncbi:hypothetical protein JVX90_00205 [Gordonia sp. PDNC005]|uniref:hypothetical protein n=1 Tax=Gordonia sp. PDNC005 TaxID=2811424 RepID=UPI0019645ACB|nr:hypothetical protein [Gordonia sp. PDNC005]QRY62734.1 hypothetical protein JVX90_00205 [Gordonia sp. PDNC005]
MTDKHVWRVTGGPVGFTSPTQPRRWQITRVDSQIGPAGGRTFTTYDQARRHVADRVRKAN